MDSPSAGNVSRNSRRGRSRLRKSIDVINRGKWLQGLTWMPRLRRSSRISSLSTMRKSSPNLSRIWSRHWTWSEAGQTTRTRLARCRMISSRATRRDSMVLPRPTSSATRRLTRGIWVAERGHPRFLGARKWVALPISRKCGMRNGEGEKADGKWQMADGKCRLAEDTGRMGDDRWRRTQAGWRMTEDRWRRTQAGWRMANGRWQMPDGGGHRPDGG